MAPSTDGSAPEIPWLKWRVDGLWRSIKRLEERCESLEVANGMDGCSQLNDLSQRIGHLENLQARMRPYGSSLQELDVRLQKHMNSMERVCSRIYADKVQDQLKEFFDEHVSRLNEFSERLRSETLNQVVCVHKQVQQELGHMSSMERDVMPNLDSRNSTKLQRAGGEKHLHQAAAVEVVTATEQRKHYVANAQLQVQPMSFHKATPNTSIASCHDITEVNKVGVGPACNGDFAATIQAVNVMGPMRRSSAPSSVSCPMPVDQNTAPIRNVADQCGGKLLGNPSRICDGPHAVSIFAGARSPSIHFIELPGVMDTRSPSPLFRSPRGGVHAGLWSPRGNL